MIVNDLDDHLPGSDRAQHLLPGRPLAHRGDEVAHHRQGDVGFQQGDADLAQRRRDIVLAERAAAAQAVEDIVEPVAQAVEHRELSLRNTDGPARETRGPAASPTNGDGEVGLILLPKARGRYRRGPGLSITGPVDHRPEGVPKLEFPLPTQSLN